MGNEISLKSIFSLKKDDLANQLGALTLPHDVQKVQKTVTDFLNLLFENEGEYRQNLTESEDFILQAAVRLLRSQQNISTEYAKYIKNQTTLVSQSTNTPSSALYLSAAGAGVGALAGSIIGSWAAVAGAIAGAALTTYCSTRYNQKQVQQVTKQDSQEIELNVEVFCTIVEKICESVDCVVDTYRVQVNRIKNTFEQRELPTLLNSYSSLIEQIASVITCSKESDIEIPTKLRNAISIMEESLENYNLKFENGKIINA